ncbi:DUF6461 domain-containing protein [Streptomyces eurythermus]|uniref:DUF6461 domain-containing protein n=1 Tax=Streptomyces eurythermus TaxID=42237 RepID=UPI0036FFB93C
MARHVSPLTRAKSTEDVLVGYGADVAGTRMLDLAAALDAFPAARGETLLRVGRRGEWTFCHEERRPLGYRPDILGRLSAGTETVCVFGGGDGMRIVGRWPDGRQGERFEPGAAHSLTVTARMGFSLWSRPPSRHWAPPVPVCSRR